MAALAVAYVAVGFLADEPTASPVYAAIDVLMSAIFIAEFGSRLVASRSRVAYLRGHWIDAVALIPTIRGLRVMRLLRLLRLVRAFAGVFRFISNLERLANHRNLAWLVTAWLGVMVICSIALYVAENGVNEAISSPFDALWWGIVTVTTVGYGDVYPITPEGRLAASALMLLGIGLFGLITATMTSYLVGGAGRQTAPILLIQQLAGLRAAGLISEDEFQRKKSDLLERL